ncbi:MAG TPA: MMPL family transporter [Rhodomicrobium sp.]|nr:MMPL family transporter [Rhodomicrobium sp.]
MLRRILAGIVVFSARARWLVLAIALAAAAYSAIYVSRHFAIDTNINNLISPDLPWRRHQFAYMKAFPGEETTILAVIDAPTAELAQSAADRLTKSLNERHDWIRGATEGNGSPFFRRDGLLYLSEPELTSTLSQLARSGPLLGRLSADPSLRGVMDSIGLSLRGVIFRKVSLDALATEFQKLSDTINDVLNGKPASFSWLSQFQTAASKPPTRQFVTISPVLNFDALAPGEEAANAIRRTVADLKLPQQGVSVRLTGPIPIADDEFNTLRQGAVENAVITVAAVLFILWLALHSFRIILAVFVSVAVGLAATAAAGLSLVGALNPISIAFFVLFVGIGVDFCLQFSVSYRAARYQHHGLMRSLAETAANNGGRLVLAALATAAGFLSFLPTAYSGVSELGEIAGMGMIIALILSLTLLPALLRMLDPPPEPLPLGYAFLRPLDRFMERHRVVIVAATIAVVFAASPLLYWLQFDINPMDLRNPKVESVATYLDISKVNPEIAGQTAEILAPSLDQANTIAKTLQALPEVARAITISNFIPEGQDQKLATIKKTAGELHDDLFPAQVKPPPTDAEVVSSLEATATSLAALASQRQGPGSRAAKDLSDSLSRLGNARPEARAQAFDVLITPLGITLENLKASLNPERVTLDTLPADLARQWKTPDGRARVSVTPKGDANRTIVLRRFVDAVLKIEPTATGSAVGVAEAGQTVVRAFIEAGIWALLSIAILLWLFLRRLTDVGLTLFPLILAAMVTLEICSGIGFKLNFANIIALPVLLGLGVAFKIYYMVAWRQGQTDLLASPLTRAVFFSGLTTAVAFGSLWMSNHPGTSSMGQLLALSLASTMAFAILFQPLLMGPPRKKAEEKNPAPEKEASLQE